MNTSDKEQALSLFTGFGIQCVPLLKNAKNPITNDWVNTEFKPKDFNGGNIGLKTGKKSRGYMDIDLDWPEAVQIARYYLPPTKFVFGRKSKPDSHLGYRSKGGTTTIKFQIPGEGMILELRGDGCQTMGPWSTHPNGELVELVIGESLGEYAYEELKRAGGRAAAACVILRRMVPGNRHDLAIAMIGCLLRASWTPEMIERWMTPILEYGAKDKKATKAILAEIAKLDAKFQTKQGRIPGYSRLKQIIGEAADYVCDWLGIGKTEEFVAKTITLREMLAKPRTEPKWVVPGLLGEGATILSGKPKSGKTKIAMNIALAVASGGMALGTKQATKTGVLFLALEDNERRLQQRFDEMLAGHDIPDDLHLFYEGTWPRGKAGVEALIDWLDQHPTIGLVIIDTLTAFREPTNGKRQLSEQDYESVQDLHNLAGERQLVLLINSHNRKMVTDDPLDSVAGTFGLVAAADDVLILVRIDRTSAQLVGRGRNIDDLDLALTWDNQLATWRIEGSGEIFTLSDAQREVLSLFKNKITGLSQPRTSTELMNERGCSRQSINELLEKLEHAGYVIRTGRGNAIVWEEVEF